MKNSRTLFKFLAYSFKVHKQYYFIMIANAIITTSMTIFNIYSLKILLDVLVSKEYEVVLKYGLIIVLINFFISFLNHLMKRLLEVGSSIMNEKMQLKVTTKLTDVPFSYLENPYYLDLKEKAKFACENQSAIHQLLNLISTFVQSGITIITLGSILIFFNFWILLIIVIAIVIHSLLMFLSMKFQINFYRQLLPINRCFGYYLQTLMNPEYQKDYRLSNIGELTLNNFSKYSKVTTKYFWRFGRKEYTIQALSEIVNYVQMAGVYIFVAVKAVNDALGAGSFTFYATSAIKFSGAVTSLIEQSVRFRSVIEYLKPLVELLDLEEAKSIGKIELGQIEQIEFDNVSFSYPSSDQLVLNNVSFKINVGEKISIVGLNGAGKTTMVKLISRLYHPSSGVIKINGIDIFEYEYRSYMAQIAAVFQDYKLFAFSISENITLQENQDDLAVKYANQVGLTDKLESLPNGVKTLYSKSFSEDGVELSGGETQKIAIARSLSKNASLIILDEPTSALDPLAEADIYRNFNEMVSDKMAIYISHRMSSSVFCDKILIIENGKVVDFDSHQALMKKVDSLYYKMFTTQAKNYIN